MWLEHRALEAQEFKLYPFSNKFSHDIFLQKYSKDGQETWEDTCDRVINAVVGDRFSPLEKATLRYYMVNRKFIPAGRYLYAAGRPYQNLNNCFLFRAEDTRQDWGDLVSRSLNALATGGGIGIDYSDIREEGALLKNLGGYAAGPIALMQIINETGRNIMQSGQRRSAIFASLAWTHPDIFKFLALKNHSEKLKAQKAADFTFPLPMELTNISVNYDTAFFNEIETNEHAQKVWLQNCRQAFETAEPGFAFNFKNPRESLRNAPVIGETKVLTNHGYVAVDDIVNVPTTIWTGIRWAKNIVFKLTKKNSELVKISLSNNKSITCSPEHPFVVRQPSAFIKIPAERLYLGFTIASTYEDYEKEVITVTKVERLDETASVYCCDVGYSEHSFLAEGVLISNCTEVVSESDSDKCNLGTVWMNRCVNLQEFQNVVHLATQFLLCGGIVSDVPTPKIGEVGKQNNRIGLGIGGMHEFLMVRGSNYEVTPEMHEWLSVYRQQTEMSAAVFCNVHGLNYPKGLRAVAPNGTLSIIAETTSGIEPLFCKAYLRRYFKQGVWLQQYVVDGTVKNLLSNGVRIEAIQDSFDLSFEQRVKFQADVQDYVDMAISSTCNLAAWGTETNNFTNVQEKADILLKYAPRLRGFTCYPDGCRAGQPLTRVDLKTALEQEGVVHESNEESCIGGICGV